LVLSDNYRPPTATSVGDSVMIRDADYDCIFSTIPGQSNQCIRSFSEVLFSTSDFYTPFGVDFLHGDSINQLPAPGPGVETYSGRSYFSFVDFYLTNSGSYFWRQAN